MSLQEALDQNTTPGLVVHYPPSLAPEPLDRAAYEAAAGPFKVGFPDLHHTVEDIAAEGDRVWVRLTNRGTHSGEFQGIAPTGNSIVMSVMAVYRMEDGRVAELWTDGDVLGLMLQLGMELTPTGIKP